MAVFDLLISRKIRVAGKLPNFHTTVNPRVFFCEIGLLLFLYDTT